MSKTINVMVLGQSGVGKSSLVNYLAGEEVAPTGTGKPVTGKDFQTIVLNEKGSDIPMTIYDSWGLESGKSEEWKDLIEKKIDHINEESDNAIHNYMHGIIYCLSLKSSRVQEFDLEMISFLASQKLHVIVALTNGDIKDYKRKIKLFKNTISQNLIGKHNLTFVGINSTEKKKLGKKEVIGAFGKEELLRSLYRDVMVNIIYLGLKKWQIRSKEQVEAVREEVRDSINRFYDDWTDRFKFKVKRGAELNSHMTSKYQRLNQTISDNLKSFFHEYSAYKKSIKHLLLAKSIKPIKFKSSGSSSFTDDSVENIIATQMTKFVPLIGPVLALFEKSFIKDELKEIQDKLDAELTEEIDNTMDRCMKSLRGNLLQQLIS